ncbi:MAG TPA: type II toxin-antitoxin system RelE/ParE family toxin [Verrucomicrobiae bacterium]|nr:type II toxin-antitoxin system RelE/ParE family toxin [Verrucomicrobiae bacterium]
MEAHERAVHYYVEPSGACPFRKWRDTLSDKLTKAAIDARIARLRSGNYGDSRPIGAGASESRIDFGPGYRVYYGVDGDDLILLAGGTKSSQSADIDKAKSFWMNYKERKRNAQKARLQSGPSRRSKK